jgi:hypothetical protein
MLKWVLADDHQKHDDGWIINTQGFVPFCAMLSWVLADDHQKHDDGRITNT